MKNTNNAGLLGTGSHMEYHYQNNKSAASTRRSRSKCIYYSNKTKLCAKLTIGCVGPSNELCKYYCEHGKRNSVCRQATPSHAKLINQLVHYKHLGIGIIVAATPEKCTIKFENSSSLQEYPTKMVMKHLVQAYYSSSRR